MVHIVREFEVSCPHDVAIAYLSDFAHAVEWDPGTVSCVRNGDPDAPVAPGASWTNVSKVLGRESTLHYELTTLGPDRVVFDGTNEAATARDDIGVTAVGDGRSRVRYEATITFLGLLRLTDPLMTLVFQRIAAETVRDLTAALRRQGALHD